MQGKSHGNRKENKEISDKTKKGFEAASVDPFKSYPIGGKKNNCAQAKTDQDFNEQVLNRRSFYQ